MTALQAYFFRQIIGPLSAILAGLTAVAILTQGLAQLDLIVDERRSGFVFIWVTLLAVPQLLSLVLPLALFFAVLYAINRMYGDQEIIVAYASGMSNWKIVEPVLKLAVIVAVGHLAIATLLQPAAFREMRSVVHDVRTDLAASLVREGAFTRPAPGLTIYARETGANGQMRDVLLHDARKPDRPVTIAAKRGAIATVEGQPALIMRDVQFQQPKADGTLDVLESDQYVIELGGFFSEEAGYLLKSSDRFLSELFFPDMTSQFDRRNKDSFLAEGHSRLASPLLNIALALVALAAMLTGEYTRTGLGRSITTAVLIALTVRVLALVVQAACARNPDLNVLQYLLPLTVCAIAAVVMVRARHRGPKGGPKKLAGPQHTPQLATAGA
jgi:lipopolysaccharide export system permease protein